MPKNLIIDANEFVFAFGPAPKPESQLLLDKIAATFSEISIRIPRTIVNEVRNNLSPNSFKKFIKYIHALCFIDEDIFVPFALGVKYEALRLKPADAFISAFAEWVRADAIISENRHFLASQSQMPFRILTAAQCLNWLDEKS